MPLLVLDFILRYTTPDYSYAGVAETKRRVAV